MAVLKDGHQAAVRLVREVLQLDRLDVFAVDAPDMVIPSWGCGGYTYSARSVVLAVDSSHPATMSAVRTTLVHEFHHVARERGPGCGTSLRARSYAQERGLSASALVDISAKAVTRTAPREATN
nr:DUF2268 domain-containing putative Zn-dependent protease [Flexivirga oryzae]